MVKQKFDITITQIKIMLNLSDPSKADKPVPFTSGILYNPLLTVTRKLSEFPYFTPDIQYPNRELEKLQYSQRVRFFFDKEKFRNEINRLASKDGADKDEIDATTSSANKPTFFKHNIKTMIELLFPTVFPIVGNYVDSYDTYIKNAGNREFDFSFKAALPRQVSGLIPNLRSHFSYFKTDNKIYTITKTIWLNDFVNHPLYRNLLDSYTEFNKWRQIKGPEIKEEIVSLKEKLKNDVTKQFTKKQNEIKKSIQNLSELIALGDARYVTRNQYIVSLIMLLLKLYIETKIVEPAYGANNNDNSFKVFKTAIKEWPAATVATPINPIIFNTQIDDTDKLLTDVENIRDKMEKPVNDIQIPRDLRDLLRPITDISRRIKNLNIIYEKYFEDLETTNINFDEDSDDIKKDFTETNYKQYFDFIKSIKLLIKPNTESSNKELQKMILEYTQAANDKFGKYLKYVKDRYLDRKTDEDLPANLKLLYVGVNSTEQSSKEIPKYEIYLHVDVIGGELTDATIPQIKCSYNGDDLGIKFNRFRKNRESVQYEVDKTRFFYDIATDGPESKKKEDEKELKEHDQKQKEISKPNNLQPPSTELKNRGGRTRKKIRKRKQYFTRKYITII